MVAFLCLRGCSRSLVKLKHFNFTDKKKGPNGLKLFCFVSFRFQVEYFSERYGKIRYKQLKYDDHTKLQQVCLLADSLNWEHLGTFFLLFQNIFLEKATLRTIVGLDAGLKNYNCCVFLIKLSGIFFV